MQKSEPGKFRSLALNSHDTVGKGSPPPGKPGAGKSLQAAGSGRSTQGRSNPGSHRASGSRPAQSRRSSQPASEASGGEDSRFRSVFEGQKPSERAIEERLAKAASPWAALAEIETRMHAQNKQVQRGQKAAAIQ